MFRRIFRLEEHQTNVRTELLAGLTTFLTMAYIIFLQPQILSGQMFVPILGPQAITGMDFGAVTMATCVSAALATLVMGLWANYPIALAPGMGENFFFVLTVIPAAGSLAAVHAGASTAWQVALGVVFISGVLFLVLSLLGVRERLLNAISPSMRNGIAVGIGLFIALIGLRNAQLVVKDPGTALKLNPHMASPDLMVFFFGLLITAALYSLRVRGAIILGIAAAALLAVGMKLAIPHLPEAIRNAEAVQNCLLIQPAEQGGLSLSSQVVSAPPSLAPTFCKMDLWHAFSGTMVPFILIFLFMDVFDTLGTLVGVSEQAGLIRDDKLPRAGRAMLADAAGTVVGAGLGTSTVTSFIESAAGVEQGGRTGLTAVTVAVLFLVAPFFYPLIAMVGTYLPITAPALVVVGSMMMRNATKVAWDNPAEALPSFLVMAGIPFTYSIGDGLALGFVSYPLVKLLAGQGRRVHWLMYPMAVVLVAYLVLVRSRTG